MTANGTRPPSDDLSSRTAGRPPLRRPRSRVLGGVCAAIATHLDVDVTVVRLAAIVIAVLTGGAALLVYLAAWLLIPQTDEPSSAPSSALSSPVAPAEPVVVPSSAVEPDVAPAAAPPARDAWRAVGADLRTLGGALRPVPPEPTGTDRGPLAGVDAALTGLGDRLRDPEVQALARRTAAGLGTAIGASRDDATRRVDRR